jgi:hypothetical protein
LLIGFCLAGSGVTDRNKCRIHAHIADSNFVTSQSRRISTDLRELAQVTVESLSEKVHSILNATDADLETIKAPDAALLEKYPAFGKGVEDMLRTRDAREDARSRGYI